MEKLGNKMAERKQRALSMTGKLVLIKSVAQVIPSFTMHTFLLPKHILSKMDSMINDFFWGIKDTKKHHLYLRS